MKQSHAIRSHFEAKQEEDKLVKNGSVSLNKNGLAEAPSHAAPSLAAWHHDPSGPSLNSGGRNGLQIPRLNMSFAAPPNSSTDDGHGVARPSDRANMLDASLSLAISIPSVSIPSVREQSVPQLGGFGSPLPTFLKSGNLQGASENVVTMHQRPPHITAQHSAQVGALPRPSHTYLPGRPPTAQLTIFYSGMVNVYDDVPADKAQAIMLLAGSGSSWSTSFMSPPSGPAARPVTTGGLASSSSAPLSASAAIPVAALPLAAPATPLVPSLLATHKPQAPGSVILHAELPHARKRSLARFLEKRKDRVRGKSPYVGTPTTKKGAADGSSSPIRDKSPSPSNGKSRTRSPSPVNAVRPQRSPSPPPKQKPAQTSGGSGSSSPTRPPTMPLPNTQEDQPSSALSRRSSKNEHPDWGGGQQLQSSSHDEKLSPMHDQAASPLQRH